MFVYHVTCNTLETRALNKLLLRNKLLFKYNLKTLFNLFSPRLKRLGYKVGIKLLNDSLVVENNNYLTKIVNFYIVYDLDYWPRIQFNTFMLMIKVSICIVVTQYHLMEQARGVFLIVHHLTLILLRKTF